MAEKGFEEEFWDIVVHDASRDPMIREVVSWTMYQAVDLEFVPEPDYYELARDMRRKYGVNEVQLDQAMEICEMELGQRIDERDPSHG